MEPMKKKNKGRVLFHIDMNSFYASVEIAHHPEWRGKPLAIAGKPEERHGIVVTSSYLARKMGVRTTMTVSEAKRKCPGLIVKHPDFLLYRRTSDQLFRMLRAYTPIVEKASIDEGYMDVTELVAQGKVQAIDLARQLQRRILNELQLPCSIGIAPNKFLAKMASNMQKPMGLTVLRKRDLAARLWPLPIGEMHGIGKRTEERLQRIGIRTIGDFAVFNHHLIGERFGKNGRRLHDRANGKDDRPVDPDAWDRYQSIGHSVTLPQDTRSPAQIRQTLGRLSDKLAAKIKKEHVVGYELMVMIRYSDFRTITRHLSTSQPIRTKEEILTRAFDLFRLHWNGGPVRLVGITVSSFQPVRAATKQLDLFSCQEDKKEEELMKLMEEVNRKFGEGTLKSAGRLKDARRNSGSPPSV